MASAQHYRLKEVKSGKNKGKLRVQICSGSNVLFESVKLYTRANQAERVIEAAKKAERVRAV